MIDLPELRCFIAVAEERHFRRAAARLHLSQPPVSARIHGLERELGVRLLDRGPGAPVSLTADGSALLPLAREAVAAAERLQAAADRLRRAETGELRVAAAAGIAGPVLADAIRRFRTRYPEVTVTLAEMDAGDQFIALAAGRLDVGVLHHVRPLTDVAAATLAEVELGILCSHRDALAGGEAVDPCDLADRDTILAVAALAPACEQALRERCQALGFAPGGSYGATGPESFVEAVGAIVGRPVVAIAPRMTSANSQASLVWRPLRGGALTVRTSALLDPAQDRVAARNFLAALADGASAL